jgi:hypothetical protein
LAREFGALSLSTCRSNSSHGIVLGAPAPLSFSGMKEILLFLRANADEVQVAILLLRPQSRYVLHSGNPDDNIF